MNTTKHNELRKEYENKGFSNDTLIDFCAMKDKSREMLEKKYQAAREIIDLIAEEMGINPETSGFFLYGLVDGHSPILDKITGYFDKGGDKVKLKKRIDDLETENGVLRSLIRK